jgi:putative DNA primase/helicase
MADDPFRPIGDTRRRGRPPAAGATKDAKEEWEVLVPIPKNAPRAPAEHFKSGKPSRTWTYHDAQGRLIGYVCRFDLASGDKEFRPLTYCRSGKGSLEWRWKAWPEPRPLYGLDRLAKRPKAPVIVCEGEKAADAAAELLPDYICVTSPNGSLAAARADWSALAGRTVSIWPDADEAGRKYAAAVAKKLQPLAAAIKTLTPPKGAADGWDAADALAGGWDRARAEAFIAEPVPRKSRRGKADGTEAEGSEPRRSKRRRSDAVLEVLDGAEFWHAPDDTPYATTPVNGHREHCKVKSLTFKRWIAHQFYKETRTVPSNQAMSDALLVIQGKAIFEGPEYQPHLRLAAYNGEIYYDLADKDWRAVQITSDGWSVVSDPPVRFERRSGMLPLPEPERGGDIAAELRHLVNLEDETSFKMLIAWLVGTFHPAGPYTMLAIRGEGGAAKTTLGKLARHFVDPHVSQLRAPPKDEETLILAARSERVVGFDNLSAIPQWLGDALCRLLTGAGFSKRELYSDDEQLITHAIRPVIVTGISSELAARADLSDRSIVISAKRLKDEARRTEEDYWADVKRRHPLILGALLDAVVCALRNADMEEPKRFRMVDFAHWVQRAEAGLGWNEGDFVKAYAENTGAAASIVIEKDIIGEAVIELVKYADWTGSASELLKTLSEKVDERTRNSKEFPALNKITDRVRRLAPALRAHGIILETERAPGGNRKRIITIRRSQDDGSRANGA